MLADGQMPRHSAGILEGRYSLSTVFDPTACLLGEGPLWHPEAGTWFWFDILNRTLYANGGAATKARHFDVIVSAAGWIDRDTLLVASAVGLHRLSLGGEAFELIAPLEADNPATRSNDGRADPAGGFWIGTMGRRAEPGAGAIYRYYRGELRQIFGAITIPNSICFAPDGSRAYFCDTSDGQIMTVALDDHGWPKGEPSVFVDLRADGLNPDGSVIDSEGGLWNAQWGAGRVARYGPDGQFDRALAVGAERSSCPCFGGEGLGRMIVTTAQQGMSPEALAADPMSGQTFEVAPGATGIAETAVVLG